MPNLIELAKSYVPILDDVYKLHSLTSVLDGANELATQGANAYELKIPKIGMSGMAPYSRNDGYAMGAVNVEYETKACNYDRGRMFQVDVMDDVETAGVAFGRMAGQFMRVKAIPELDAFRLCAYAGAAGIGTASGALANGKAVVTALRLAANAMDEAEAPPEERYLFILPSLYGAVQDMDTTSSRAVMDRFAKVIQTPPSRMNTGVTLGADGFTLTGDTINFLVAHKPALIQYQKHVAPKIIAPEANQNADAWRFGYRSVGIAEVYDNKKAGIYAHIGAVASPPED